MKTLLSSKPAVAALVALSLCACGGGDSSVSAPAVEAPPAAPAGATRSASGVVTVQSGGKLQVNGTSYSTDARTAVRVDGQARALEAIKTGMVVKLRARQNGAGALAEKVDADNEMRGTVSAVDAAANPKNFSIGAVKVIVNADTKYDALPNGFDSIKVGLKVEVYGLKNAAGALVASRVEGVDAPDLPDELKGVVAELNAAASTFKLGAVTVNFAGATFAPAGATAASLANGLQVEVDGAFDAAGTGFKATRVEIDDKTADGELEIEGYIAQLTVNAAANSGGFSIDGQAVTFDGTTTLRDGALANLANNVRVEVEGALLGTTLRASVIAFKPPAVLLTGRPTAVVATGLTLFGKTIAINAETEWVTPIAQIMANVTRVEVKVRVGAGGALTAERIADVGTSRGGLDKVKRAFMAPAAFTAEEVELED